MRLQKWLKDAREASIGPSATRGSAARPVPQRRGRSRSPARRPSAACGAERRQLVGRHGADDLVIVAAGQDRLDQPRFAASARLRRADSGTRATSISADTPEARQSLPRSPASPSDTSIAAEACAAAHRQARCAAAAPDSARRDDRASRRRASSACAALASLRSCKSERGVADRAGDHDHGRPACAPARCTMVPCGSVPNAVIETVTGPGVRTVSPPSSGQPYASASAPSPRAKCSSHASSMLVRQRERQQESRGLRALGGEIGQIHPQRLARDRVRRIVGKEMHAADDRVGRQHQFVAGRRLEASRRRRSARARRDGVASGLK